MKPKAIFFDLDETLIENHIPIPALFGKLFEEAAKKYEIDDIDSLRQNFRSAISNLWDTMFESARSPEEQLIDGFNQALKRSNPSIGVETPPAGEAMLTRFLELNESGVRFNPGAVETLTELRERGFITGLITNGIEAVQSSKINALKVHELVDHVTISAQARAHKPHAPVFKLALSRAGVAAPQAWQIGDHATNDVAGGIRAGLSGVFYNPNNLNVEESFAELDERPTYTIAHHGELLDLLS